MKILKNTALGAISLISTVIFSSNAIAQVIPAPTLSEQTLREAQQQERGSLDIGGSNLNLLQLINQINLAGGKSSEQFNREQSESLNDAVTNFRNQQRKEIQISIPK